MGNESGIAAGVRRIVAYTSKGAFDYLRIKTEELKALRDRLKASSEDTNEIMIQPPIKLFSSEKELRKEIEKLQAKNAGGEVDELLKSAEYLAVRSWLWEFANRMRQA